SEILVCDVWMMKDCVTKSLTKMFTIKSPFDRIVLPFRMNGEAITEMTDHDEKSMHEVYESCLGDFNAIGIQGDYLSLYNVSSYTGSLLLLDESDTLIPSFINGKDISISEPESQEVGRSSMKILLWKPRVFSDKVYQVQ
nr:hypothetical protein [Tanacetum cinerariifolium]